MTERGPRGGVVVASQVVRGEWWEWGMKSGDLRFFSQPTNQEFLKMPQRCICRIFVGVPVVLRSIFVVGGILCRMRVWGLGLEGVVMFCNALYVRQGSCWLRCVPGWRTLPQREGANFDSGRVVAVQGRRLVRPRVRDQRSQLQRILREHQRCREVSCAAGIESRQCAGGCGSDLLHIDHPRGLCQDVRHRCLMSAVSYVETTFAGAVPSAFDVCRSGLPTSAVSGGDRLEGLGLGDRDEKWFGLLFRQRPGRHRPRSLNATKDSSVSLESEAANAEEVAGSSIYLTTSGCELRTGWPYEEIGGGGHH